jgi:hypothetical protein
MTQRSMTPDEARKEFFPQIGRAAFYSALRRGEIPHLKVGKKIIIPRNAIEQLFENCSLGGRTPKQG